MNIIIIIIEREGCIMEEGARKEPEPTGSRPSMTLSDQIGPCKPTHETPPPNTQREGKEEASVLSRAGLT